MAFIVTSPVTLRLQCTAVNVLAEVAMFVFSSFARSIARMVLLNLGVSPATLDTGKYIPGCARINRI